MAKSVVTGANRGIGLELCRQLAARGDDVIAVCRRSSEDLQELSVRIETGIDMVDGGSIANLARRLEGVKIDWLLNVAGILSRQTLENLDVEAIRRQFEVNALGPLRVTTALLANFTQGSKVGIVTSRMGSIADNTSGGHYGYRMSKAAVNMAGVSLAHDLRSLGIAVALLHPGYVRTDMTSGHGDVGPDQAARGLIERMDQLTLETSGGFWHAKGERLPW